MTGATGMTGPARAPLPQILAGLIGARLQAARGPELDGVVQLQLYRPDGLDGADGRRVWLDVWAREGVAGAWRTADRRPNRVPQGSFVMFLRKHAVGRALVEVRGLPDGIALGWARASGDASGSIGWLVARADALAWVEGRRHLAFPGRPKPETLTQLEQASPAGVAVAGGPPLSEAEAALAARAAGRSASAGAASRHGALARACKAAHKRQQRLVRALRGDLAKAQQAEALREQGEVLKVQLHAVPQGADQVELPVPWEPDRTVTIALRRELSPRDNLARLFRRARGLERHRSAIEARLAEAEARSAALAELRAAIAADVAGDQAPELEARAAALAVRGAAPQAQRSRKQQTRSLPAGVQRWTSPAGAEVLVGRSAAANDTLVTRLARGRDIWMHVRDRRGAHLLLRSGKDAQPALAELQACAALCAWASGVRRGDRVDVTWTWARHVRKAKGSAPGLVYIAKEHTLRVDVHDAVIAAFKERRSAEAKGAKGS